MGKSAEGKCFSAMQVRVRELTTAAVIHPQDLWLRQENFRVLRGSIQMTDQPLFQSLAGGTRGLGMPQQSLGLLALGAVGLAGVALILEPLQTPAPIMKSSSSC